MPRKSRKSASQKCPLQFLEAPLGGARLQNGPEVRAALNPRSFTTETQRRNAFTSWVSPQFEESHLAPPPPRRGRRRCQSTLSILDGTSQLRTSRFPSLSFQEGPRDKSHRPRGGCRKKATEAPLVSGPEAQQQRPGLGDKTGPLQKAQDVDTPKRPSASLQKRNSEDSALRDCAAISSRCSGQHPIRELSASTPAPVEPHTPALPEPHTPAPPETSTPAPPEPHTPALPGAPTPAPVEPHTPAPVEPHTPAPPEPHTPDAGSVFSPPDVDTPEWDIPCPSTRWQHLVQPLSQMSTPPNHLTEVLVSDTPEEDYGVRVTWRKRKGLMVFLKDKGYLC